MSCNDGLHGALYQNYKGEWSCLACGEAVDWVTLEKLRRKNEDPQHKDGIRHKQQLQPLIDILKECKRKYHRLLRFWLEFLHSNTKEDSSDLCRTPDCSKSIRSDGSSVCRTGDKRTGGLSG